MKQRILVLYYTQSGQLRDILNSVTRDIAEKATLTFCEIRPVTPWPFPWKASTFFDAMPESVLRRPAPVKPLAGEIVNGEWDLIIFGYQPWFLHPSQPTTAFLQSADAKQLFKGKPVVTVVGSRNMWLNAEECVKEDLQAAGARLVGNIVLMDTNTNLVSLLTVIRWSFKGQKEASRFLPAAGVQDKDIKGAVRFGPIIAEHLANNTLDTLQNDLLRAGAIDLNTGLVLLEQRGIKNFRFWANYISAKGGVGDSARAGRVKQFMRLLLTAIFVLSPISSVTAFVQRKLRQKSLRQDVAYFKQVGYVPGKM